MKDTTRARVAAIVGSAVKRQSVSSVYDYSMSGHRSISATVSDSGVSGYDYSTSSHFSGGGGGALDFYDYHNAKHVQLALDGYSFSGYDYDSGRHFSGTANGGSIAVYDYETSKHYNYSV